ncbi:MAG: HAMP domain-containing protein [Asticcacaulis sp.]
MTIKAKILLLVAAFAIMATAITALGLRTMRDYDRVIDDYTRASGNAFRAERLNLLVADTSLELRNIYVSRTPEETERRIATLDKRVTEMQALVAQWQAEATPSEAAEFKELAKGVHDVAGFAARIEKIARDDGPEAAEKAGLLPAAVAYRERFQARLDGTAADIQARMQARQADLKVYQAKRMGQFLLIAATGIVALLLASLWIAIRSIADPLRRVTQSIIRLSQGAYDTAIPAADGTDEISRLWRALGILKSHAIEAKRLNDQKLELHLD